MSNSDTISLLDAAVPQPEVLDIDPSKLDLSEEVIQLNRVAKVVKGGRRFSFSALVVVGDKNGHVGLGFGKANEVPDSITKGVQDAKKNLIRVPIVNRTIPYMVTGEFSAARVLLRPASEGTGLIAGPAVRAVLELAGLHDLLTKSLGCSNVINILKAVMQGLGSLRDAEEAARLRGKELEEMVGRKRAKQLRQMNATAQKGKVIEEEEDVKGTAERQAEAIQAEATEATPSPPTEDPGPTEQANAPETIAPAEGDMTQAAPSDAAPQVEPAAEQTPEAGATPEEAPQPESGESGEKTE